MYIPSSAIEEKELLGTLGISTWEDLIADIPQRLRVKSLNLPLGRDENAVARYIKEKLELNTPYDLCFAGCGVYDHIIPAAVHHITGRSEFYTAYTPYQPEISQGTLTAIFEYQTMICRLTGMDISNASLYDGANALIAAVQMMITAKKLRSVVVQVPIHPFYQSVLTTFAQGQNIDIIYAELDLMVPQFSSKIAGVVLFQPTFFGELCDYTLLIHAAKEKGLFIAVGVSNLISLGAIAAPGDYGADIVFGEGQSLGNAMNAGGPGLGVLAAKSIFLRQMPGRIVGQTVDCEGNVAYVLTMQTREQHIRREKATSNICSNQALNALAATVYLSLMGPYGLQKIAQNCIEKVALLRDKLAEINGIEIVSQAPCFQELVIRLPVDAAQIFNGFKEKKILAGVDLGQFHSEWVQCLSIAVTEKITVEDIHRYVEIMKNICEKQ